MMLPSACDPSFSLSQTPDPIHCRTADFAREYRQSADGLFVWMHLHVQPGLRGRVSADDLIQETWCRAYQAWSRFDPDRGSFRNWLLGIGENVLVEELRRLARRPTPVGQLPSSMSVAPSQVAAELTSISERAARSEFAGQLLAFANRLNEGERQLLLSRGVEELSYDEVSLRLGITAEAARSRWRRLRERIRRQLRGFEITLPGLAR